MNSLYPPSPPQTARPTPHTYSSAGPNNPAALPSAVGPDGSRFSLSKILGSGSFGVVFAAVDTLTGVKVAVKLERADCKHPQLAYEHRVLRWLSPPTEGPLPAFTGFPVPLWFGSSTHHSVLVESLHGPSLEDLFTFCGRVFSLKTALTLGLQMVSRVQAAHAKQILHRDIKPDNFVLGSACRHAGSGGQRPAFLSRPPAPPHAARRQLARRSRAALAPSTCWTLGCPSALRTRRARTSPCAATSSSRAPPASCPCARTRARSSPAATTWRRWSTCWPTLCAAGCP